MKGVGKKSVLRSCNSKNVYPREVSDCCQWEGVKCNITTRRVTQLSLGYGLLSYLEFFNASLFFPFGELRSLDLSYNDLVGCVENGVHNSLHFYLSLLSQFSL